MPPRSRVVNLRTSPYDVYIGRGGKGQPGPFGNPIRRGESCPICGQIHTEPGETLFCFEEYFHRRILHDAAFRKRVEGLRGKTLGCFCKPRPCHGDVIVDWLNKEDTTLDYVLDSFHGNFRWLSNFYEVSIILGGYTFSSVEHAYQAAKAATFEDFKKIHAAATPGKAKKLGGQCKQRPEWDDRFKVRVMFACLLEKFKDINLQARLISTGDAPLVEGNAWGDRFWGVCNGEGKNKMGELLMIIREYPARNSPLPEKIAGIPFYPDPPKPEGILGLVAQLQPGSVQIGRGPTIREIGQTLFPVDSLPGEVKPIYLKDPPR